MDRLVLLIAQGLGTGRSPVAPGTVGTLLGLPLYILLLLPGSFVLFVSSLLVLSVASVWLCGRAETILGQRDPSSVVIDEIVAICRRELVDRNPFNDYTFPMVSLIRA